MKQHTNMATAIQNEIINLTGTVDKRIADILIGRWEMQTDFFIIPLQFKPEISEQDLYRKFGTDKKIELASGNSRIGGSTETKGKWELIKNRTVVKLSFMNKQFLYAIDYIGRYET